jgi:hypothetical protein
MRCRLLEGWNSFRATVLRPEAGRLQIALMRHAYYAGAIHLFWLLNDQSVVTNEEQTKEFLDDLASEFRHYREQIQKGAA